MTRVQIPLTIPTVTAHISSPCTALLQPWGHLKLASMARALLVCLLRNVQCRRVSQFSMATAKYLSENQKNSLCPWFQRYQLSCQESQSTQQPTALILHSLQCGSQVCAITAATPESKGQSREPVSEIVRVRGPCTHGRVGM